MELDALAESERVGKTVLADGVAFGDARFVFSCGLVLAEERFENLHKNHFVLDIDGRMRIDRSEGGQRAQAQHAVACERGSACEQDNDGYQQQR